MLVVSTGNKDWDEEIKDKLDGQLILETKEDIIENIGKLDEVVLARHLDWTQLALKSILELLKDFEVTVHYIANTEIKSVESAEEISVLMELDIKNIYFNVKQANHFIDQMKTNDFFNEDDYYKDVYNTEEQTDDFDYEEEKEEQGNYIISNNGNIDTDLDNGKEEKGKTDTEVIEEKPKKKKKESKENKEGIIRFIFNYIYKLLALIVSIIISLLESIQWIVLSVILTGAAYYLFKELEIDSMSKLAEEAINLLNKLRTN